MPSISLSLDETSQLEMIVTLPKSGEKITASLTDPDFGDVLLKMEFDFKNSRFALSNRSDGRWNRKPEAEFKFEKYNRIFVKICEERFLVVLNGTSFEHDITRSVLGRRLRLRTDFDYVTVDSTLNSEQHFAMRWPFFLRYESRPWLTSRMSLMPDVIAQQVGVSAIVAFDGNEKALTDLVSALHEAVDEIVIAIHDPSSVNIAFFGRLQSTYFNVVYHTAPYLSNDNKGDVDRAYFLNGVFERCRYRNIVLLDPYDDMDQVRSLVETGRVRTRSDHFAIVGVEKSAVRPTLLALSLRRSTYVLDAGGRLTLPDDDLAVRNIDFVGEVDIPGSLNWSIDVGDKFSADGVVKKVPAVFLRGYLKSHTPPRRPRVVFMIVSCKANRHKQEAIRRTWLAALDVANIEHIFIEGDPVVDKAVLLDDRLFVKSQDSYEYLAHKIHKAIKAIREIYNPDHILKIDDDCACNVQKFMEIDLGEFEYLGSNIIDGRNSTYDWHRKSLSNDQLRNVLFKPRKEISWFDGGGGYVLGRKAIDIVAGTDLLKFSHMFEDYAMGRALHGKVRMSASTCSRFTSIRDAHIHGDEDYRNTLVTDVHSLERMQEINERFELENNRAKGLRGGIDVVVS